MLDKGTFWKKDIVAFLLIFEEKSVNIKNLSFHGIGHIEILSFLKIISPNFALFDP